MSSLKKLAISGAIWTFLGYGTSQALRLGSNLILTRLLVPEMFGLMALVNVFIMGLNLFSDIGLGPSIIQNKRGDDPDFLNTAWTMQVIRGFGLWLGCLVIVWPLAQFYKDPRLIWLIPIVGLTTIFAGFNSTSLFSLNRQIALGKLTLFELGTQVVTLIIMITWAWFSRSIWALVVGNLVGALLKMLGSHWLIPEYSNRFTWDRAAAKEIFSFGKWIFFSTAVTFLATQMDRILLGKLLSFSILGIYTVAFTLASIPEQVVSRVASKVMFPIVSQLADLPRASLRAKILDKRRFILAGIGLMVIFLVCFGDLLILLLYDDRYSQAAWMLPIIALGIWPYLLFETSRQSLMAIGKPNYQAFGQFAKSIHVCIGLPLGFYFLGLPGFIIMVALNDIELYGVVSYGLWREELSCFQQDIKATALLVIVLTLVLTGRFMLGFGLPISQLFISS
ncbi:MAG: oligosaccharide flippase family protein [Moorea sp. SIO2B7]|nr:oligosaccharide flippase family protein [Moorena sp. SIO2B7]